MARVLRSRQGFGADGIFDFWWQAACEGKGREADDMEVAKVERVRGTIVLAFKTNVIMGVF